MRPLTASAGPALGGWRSVSASGGQSAAARHGVGVRGLAAIRRYIDHDFRASVQPVPGSVVYCDWVGNTERSGIYHGEGQIISISVPGAGESTVCASGTEEFVSNSLTGDIYVSCDEAGNAVGHPMVDMAAHQRLGQRSFYGLLIKNSHGFCTECVCTLPPNFNGKRAVTASATVGAPPGHFPAPTFAALEDAVGDRLGGRKWLLWSQGEPGGSDRLPVAEPDWERESELFRQMPLNTEGIAAIRREIAATLAYEAEISGEEIPEEVRRRLALFRESLVKIDELAKQAEEFLARCPDAGWSYETLKDLPSQDFAALAAQLRSNPRIAELVRKLGRDHVSEYRRKRCRVPKMSRSEAYGVHMSDDLGRLLPIELINLDDETLETLFFARMLEKRLLSYELAGVNYFDEWQEQEKASQTGPIVACLDTSESMEGQPLLRARALLLAVANILKHERRSLHVLLFGASGDLREMELHDAADTPALLRFISQGFGGGTDFETPLKRATEIIAQHPGYLKADILMISDGDCSLSSPFSTWLCHRKEALGCTVYSVLCNGQRVNDSFSDDVLVL